jgi:hypothetical protein
MAWKLGQLFFGKALLHLRFLEMLGELVDITV